MIDRKIALALIGKDIAFSIDGWLVLGTVRDVREPFGNLRLQIEQGGRLAWVDAHRYAYTASAQREVTS